MCQKLRLGLLLVFFILINLIFLFSWINPDKFQMEQGGILRGDRSQKSLTLIFTGGDFAEGGQHIRDVLKKKNIKAGFFFTGDFYRKPVNYELISQLVEDGHYLGPHSDKHLLYCSWEDRDKLLVTKEKFISDLLNNYRSMEAFGLTKKGSPYFIPPYEWYNRTISDWSREMGITLFNFTPGTLSNADYTTPSMPNYKSSEEIFNSIKNYEGSSEWGLNGFILLLHIGTHPERTDKFYFYLEDLINYIDQRGYTFLKVDELLAGGMI
jgi:peptidoglycan/xylan/chitin deacetylase (PgdA/CDA1 family)